MSSRFALFVGHDVIGLETINRLIPKLIQNGFDPVLYNTRTHKNRSPIAPPLADVVFYDETLLDQVVFPHIEQHGSQHILSFNQLTEKYQIEHHNIENVDDLKLNGRYAGALSVRFKQIFSSETIGHINDHSDFLWNLHGGILPDYKGILCSAWARMNCEQHFGNTLHEVDAKIDTGAIINRVVAPLVNRTSVRDDYIDLIPQNVEMIISSVKNKSRLPVPQNGKGQYFPFPTQNQMSEFGLAYCTPKEGFDYYISRFGGHNGLNQKLVNAIKEHHQPTQGFAIPLRQYG